MTAEQMAALAEEGRYWWMRPSGEFYATSVYDDTSTDLYLLDASPKWVEQWASWDEAVAVLSPMFDVLDEFRN